MTSSTKIKICGIRRPEDCVYINEAMPDYAGFIFWDKSFRYVDERQAAGLRRLTDDKIITVGVFVNENADRIAEIAAAGTISVVQLHGSEDAEYVSELRSLLPQGIKVWKAFKIRSIDDINAAMCFDADRVLLDNGYGTGQCFDHSLLDALQFAEPEAESSSEADKKNIVSAGGIFAADANISGGRIFRKNANQRHNEYILAGGLTPENIGDAIAKYHPYMIDISSGVETDGCKDREKIMRAVAACHSCIK